ncbi:TNF receptor-associated factor 6-like, partial [Rhipicephalus microplus]|uniref:TNF receptor-associated factor 6-like n=1 Tax=Rhipicephalus microplus TaxID=6941 RepID=UPI003F6B80DE
CEACGLVTRLTAILPCRHIFCKNCYEQCSTDDRHSCPIDGEQILAEDVDWRECPVHNPLKRKVQCWNEDHGCNVILAASELNEHFCKECNHHSTSCPRCSMVVRCDNVRAHMQNECVGQVMSVASGNRKSNTTTEKELMAASNANIETRVGEIKQTLDHFTQAQCNRLKEISQSMSMVKELLLEILSRTSTLGSVASSAEAMHETLNDHIENLQQLAGTMSNSHETLKNVESTALRLERKNEDTGMLLRADLTHYISDESGALKDTLQKELKDATKTICNGCAETVATIVGEKISGKQIYASVINTEKILALATIPVRRLEFCVAGFKAMKESALSKGYCLYPEKRTFISGYHLSPGVYLEKKEQHVYLHSHIQLHKGVIDDVLQWPFKKKVRFTIKHPTQNKECRNEEVCLDGLENFTRPVDRSNAGIYFFVQGYFSPDNLEREGYVRNDKLCAVLELISVN